MMAMLKLILMTQGGYQLIKLSDLINRIWTEDVPIFIFTAEHEMFDYGKSSIPLEVLSKPVRKFNIYDDGLVEIILGE